MAKEGMIKREKKRLELYNKFNKKRSKLKAELMNKEATLEERFAIQLKINALPRNSSKARQRNRCLLTGRPRGYYRKFKMSRIKFRDLASIGQIPGVKKSSW